MTEFIFIKIDFNFTPHPRPFSKGEGGKVLSLGEDLGEV